MNQIYHIRPIYKDFVWAGHKLIDYFGLRTELPNVGTIYTVIADKGNLDNIVEETGEVLSDFYKSHSGLFDCPDDIFPVRMTITCNESFQSYQLHPDDVYALAHEGTRGKVSGAAVLFPSESDPPLRKRRQGHRCRNLEEFKRLVAAEDWDNLFDTIDTAEGYFVHTPAGVIHGGKGGGRISVTFGTNSDITYRFYDYGRNDPKRPLNLQAVFDCLHFPEVPLENGRRPVYHESDGVSVCEYHAQSGEYVAKRLKVEAEGSFEYPHFAFYTCVAGDGTVDGIAIHPGETLFVPSGYGKVRLTGKLDLCFLSYYREVM